MGAYKVFYTDASRTDIGAGSGVKPAASGGGLGKATFRRDPRNCGESRS
jgi:hypothetical protein